MSKVLDSVLGQAIGEAMGIPLKFKERKSLFEKPVTEMVGNGSYNVPSGTWGCVTSFTLATMDSIIKAKGLDYEDLTLRFCNFMEKSEYTAAGEAFDIPRTSKKALQRYLKKREVFDGSTTDNGNGSLLRMLPIAIYSYYEMFDDDELYDAVKRASMITNASDVCVMGCFIYCKYVHLILDGADKVSSYRYIKDLTYAKFTADAKRCYKRFLMTDFDKMDIDYIKSSDYVADTLEAVIWVILNTNSFAEAIVGAINLGGDTSTIGALTGALAGIIYGYDDIPPEFISGIKNRDLVLNVAKDFEKNVRERVMKYDQEFKNQYGVILGNNKVLFIKTEMNSNIYGVDNRYLKIARKANYLYGVTVVVSACQSMDKKLLDRDFELIDDCFDEDYEIYYMGVASGALLGIQYECDNLNIRKMMLVNTPLTVNLHKTKEGIEKFDGELFLIYGDKDLSVNYIPLIKEYESDKLKIIKYKGQDHTFNRGNEFLNLPFLYLIKSLKK